MNQPRSLRGDQPSATHSPAIDRRVRARRGLTIIELLLGIALLGALGGIVFASLRPLRDAARTRAGMDRIDAFVRDVRDLAMRSGEPVTVELDPLSGRLHAEWLTAPPGMRGTLGAGAGVTGAGGGDADPWAGAGGIGGAFDDDPRRVEEPWAELRLDARLRLTASRPDPEAMDALGGGSSFEMAGAQAGAGGEFEGGAAAAMFGELDPLDAEPVRLVVLMPDGTTLLARSAWLTGTDVSVHRLDVHPWTGEPGWTDLGELGELGIEDEGMFSEAGDPALEGPSAETGGGVDR